MRAKRLLDQYSERTQTNSTLPPVDKAYFDPAVGMIIPHNYAYCHMCENTIKLTLIREHMVQCVRKHELQQVPETSKQVIGVKRCGSSTEEPTNKRNKKANDDERDEDNREVSKENSGKKTLKCSYHFLLLHDHVFEHQTGLSRLEFEALHTELHTPLRSCCIDKSSQKMVDGRARILDTKQQLTMFLMWMRRNYRLDDLIVHFQISVSRCHQYNHRTLDIVFNHFRNDIHVPVERWQRLKEAVRWRGMLVSMIIDGSEQQIKIYRHNKMFEQSTFSGKKNKHTFTKLIAVTPKTGRVIAISESYNGAHNDAGMYTAEHRRFEEHLESDEFIGGDPAFSGIKHARIVNLKKQRGKELTKEEEEYNNDWASVRIVVENTISQIKNWNICRNTLHYVGLPSEGRDIHHKLWVVASVFVNKFSLPRKNPNQ